jgi:glycosyltransferase involved in cell wall biosynthesis
MPPFDYDYWAALVDNKPVSEASDKPYLMVSRLVHYKRVDLVIEAFKRMPSRRLIIIGDGALLNRLSHDTPTNVTFRNNVTDKELAKHYASAKALIMPQREDFGYVALEAQACGCPVIAYKKGGAQSTILENETGIFIESQNIEALQKALDKFEEVEYTIRHSLEEKAKNHLAQFSLDTFKKKFNKLILE